MENEKPVEGSIVMVDFNGKGEWKLGEVKEVEKVDSSPIYYHISIIESSKSVKVLLDNIYLLKNGTCVDSKSTTYLLREIRKKYSKRVGRSDDIISLKFGVIKKPGDGQKPDEYKDSVDCKIPILRIGANFKKSGGKPVVGVISSMIDTGKFTFVGGGYYDEIDYSTESVTLLMGVKQGQDIAVVIGEKTVGEKIVTGRIVSVLDHGQKCDILRDDGFSEKDLDIYKIISVEDALEHWKNEFNDHGEVGHISASLFKVYQAEGRWSKVPNSLYSASAVALRLDQSFDLISYLFSYFFPLCISLIFQSVFIWVMKNLSLS